MNEEKKTNSDLPKYNVKCELFLEGRMLEEIRRGHNIDMQEKLGSSH